MRIGGSAPDITAEAYFPVDGKMKKISFADSKGKWVILTFYPGDFTFVCATDIDAFMKKYADFEKKIHNKYGSCSWGNFISKFFLV